MSHPNWHGVFPALTTQFHPDESLNIPATARHLEHMIASGIMTALGVSSKLNAEWEFFRFLRDEGRRRADEFLASHAAEVGHRSTVDIERLLID